MSLDAKEKEAGVEQSGVVLSRDFPSIKGAYEDAKAFFMETITSYYGKDAPGRTPDRKEISDDEMNNLVGGFGEIFSNALFHGNLGLEGKVSDFLDKLSSDPQWKPDMNVHVTISLHPRGLEVTIRDEGRGKFEISKIVERIRRIAAGDIAAILEPNARAYLMIRDDQFGAPAKVRFHHDADGNKTGTTVTPTRNFDEQFPGPTKPENYVVVE